MKNKWNEFFLYPPPGQTKFGVIYWFQPVCLSVCLLVCLSVCSRYVNMILSTNVIENGCMDFFGHLYTRNSPSEDVHLEFSYWFGKFSSFNRLILFWNLIIFKTRNIYCLKNYEELWFKHWKCVVPLLKLCISYFNLQYVESCELFSFRKWRGRGSSGREGQFTGFT